MESVFHFDAFYRQLVSVLCNLADEFSKDETVVLVVTSIAESLFPLTNRQEQWWTAFTIGLHSKWGWCNLWNC